MLIKEPIDGVRQLELNLLFVKVNIFSIFVTDDVVIYTLLLLFVISKYIIFNDYIVFDKIMCLSWTPRINSSATSPLLQV